MHYKTKRKTTFSLKMLQAGGPTHGPVRGRARGQPSPACISGTDPAAMFARTGTITGNAIFRSHQLWVEYLMFCIWLPSALSKKNNKLLKIFTGCKQKKMNNNGINNKIINNIRDIKVLLLKTLNKKFWLISLI